MGNEVGGIYKGISSPASALILRGRVLRVSGTSLYYDSGFDVELTPGRLVISKLTSNDDSWIGIDVVADSDFSVGELLGETIFPFGQFGLFDKSAVDANFDAMADMGAYYIQIQNSLQSGEIELGDGIVVPFFRCEDGASRVYELLGKAGIVGVRLLFGHSEEADDEEQPKEKEAANPQPGPWRFICG